MFELSILNAKLPHDKLRTVFHKLIDFFFDGGEKNFILPNYFGANNSNPTPFFSKVYIYVYIEKERKKETETETERMVIMLR